jgi:uncharacterized protein (TIGR03435 family)
MRTILFASLMVSTALAQSDQLLATFEVASVKPSAGPHGRIGCSGGVDAGGFNCEYTPLAQLVSLAYGLPAYRINGLGSAGSSRYDVIAKVPRGTTREQVRLMWQNLLVSRFNWLAHYAPKEMTGYALVVAKEGPRLQGPDETLQAPAPTSDSTRGSGVSLDAEGFPILPPGRGGASISVAGRTSWRAVNVPMQALTQMVEVDIGRQVIDETGLQGGFDFVLSWVSLGYSLSGSTATPTGSRQQGVAADTFGPTMFNALEKQLGLKLVPRTSTVQVLVVDRVSKSPTEN